MKSIIDSLSRGSSVIEDDYLTRKNIQKHLFETELQEFSAPAKYGDRLGNIMPLRYFKSLNENGLHNILIIGLKSATSLPCKLYVGQERQEIVDGEEEKPIYLIGQDTTWLQRLEVVRIPESRYFLCNGKGYLPQIEVHRIFAFPSHLSVDSEIKEAIPNELEDYIKFSLRGRDEISENFQKVIKR